MVESAAMSDSATTGSLFVPDQPIRLPSAYGNDGLPPPSGPPAYSEPVPAHSAFVRDPYSYDSQHNTAINPSPLQESPVSRYRDSRRVFRSHIFSNYIKSINHWLHLVWLDIATIITGLLVALILRHRLPIFYYNERGFLVRKNVQGHWEAPMDINWPRYIKSAHNTSPSSGKGTVSPDFIMAISTTGVLVAGVALAIFLLMQLVVRDLWDKVAATMGMLKALVTV